MVAFCNSCYYRNWAKGHGLAWAKDMNGIMSNLTPYPRQCNNSGWRDALTLHKAVGLQSALGTKWEPPTCVFKLQHKSLFQGGSVELAHILLPVIFQCILAFQDTTGLELFQR